MALPTHFGDNLLRRIHSEPGDSRQPLDCILVPLEHTCDEDLGGVAFVAVEVALFLNEDVAVSPARRRMPRLLARVPVGRKAASSLPRVVAMEALSCWRAPLAS
jgi:hypothetical protein